MYFLQCKSQCHTHGWPLDLSLSVEFAVSIDCNIECTLVVPLRCHLAVHSQACLFLSSTDILACKAFINVQCLPLWLYQKSANPKASDDMGYHVTDLSWMQHKSPCYSLTTTYRLSHLYWVVIYTVKGRHAGKNAVEHVVWVSTLTVYQIFRFWNLLSVRTNFIVAFNKFCNLPLRLCIHHLQRIESVFNGQHTVASSTAKFFVSVNRGRHTCWIKIYEAVYIEYMTSLTSSFVSISSQSLVYTLLLADLCQVWNYPNKSFEVPQ